MNPKAIPWLFLAASLFITGCKFFQIEAGFKQPSELMATAEAQPARPAPTPKPQLGKLAFVRGGDLWLKELPDGDERRLTQDGRNGEPRWSASGEWLAFRKDYQVWATRPDGSKARAIGRSGRVELFAWSPAEDLLAYTYSGGLHIEQADGSQQDGSQQNEAVPPLPGPSPQGRGVTAIAWSPDGQWVAFEKLDYTKPSSQGLWRARADGSEVREVYLSPKPLLSQSHLAGWTPDGRSLLYWQGQQMSSSLLADGVPLMQVAVGGGDPVTVTNQPVLHHQDFLSWSSDGKKLALVSGGGRSTWENKAIAVTTLAGDLRNLSDSGKADIFPSWSPDGRRLALASGPASPGVGGGESARQSLSQRRIWVQESDGSAKRQLTEDADFRDERPQWSMDGQFILFARLKGEGAQVWLMRGDGSEKRRVVDELTPSPNWFGNFGYLVWSQFYDWWPGPGRRPAPPTSVAPPALLSITPTAVSPPATSVAPPPAPLKEGDVITERGLYVADTTTGKLWRADGSIPQWAWSPDGKTLARSLSPCCEGTGGLDLLDFAANSAIRIANGDIVAPAWSPDGKQLAFSRLKERPSSSGDSVGLYTINRDGSGLEQHSLLPGILAISWAPGGSHIAFRIGGEGVFLLDLRNGEVAEIARSRTAGFVWSRDGRSLVLGDVTGLYLYDVETNARRQLMAEEADNPTLSPDGSQILMSRSKSPGGLHPPDAREFFVAGFEAPASAKLLAVAQTASWSPDGKRIAYLNNGCQGKGGDWDIYTTQVDGGMAKRLTDSPKSFKEGVSWSPRSSSIAFTVGGKIMLVDADSGALRTLASSGGNPPLPFHMHGSPWSPDGRYVVFQFGLGHGYCE